MWGVQSDAMWCPVFLRPFQTEGTHSEAQNGEKVIFTAIMDPKSQFLVPHFRPIFFLFKIWASGVSRVMPCDTRSFCNLFKRKGPTQRLKTAKKSFLRSFWTLNPNFLAIMSHWLGPLGLKRLRKAQTSHGKPRGPTQQLKTAEKLGFWVQNGHKTDFLVVLSLWVGSLAFEKVAERPGITWHRSGHPTCPYFEEKKKLAKNEVPKIGIWGP